MYRSISELIKNLIAGMSESEGEITVKLKPIPKIKPPRRNPSVKNKSNRTDYMKNYMKEYREEGKDYQKVPDKIKELRKKQRKKQRKKPVASLYIST